MQPHPFDIVLPCSVEPGRPSLAVWVKKCKPLLEGSNSDAEKYGGLLLEHATPKVVDLRLRDGAFLPLSLHDPTIPHKWELGQFAQVGVGTVRTRPCVLCAMSHSGCPQWLQSLLTYPFEDDAELLAPPSYSILVDIEFICGL